MNTPDNVKHAIYAQNILHIWQLNRHQNKTITYFNSNIHEKALLTGDRVFHEKFGYGIIKKIEGNNAEVAFSKTNLKKVKIEYLIKNA